MAVMKYVAFTILIFLFPPASQGENQRTDEYKFGVFPYLSAVRMDNIYAPISDQLSQNLNHKVQFRTSSTFKKFLEKLKAEYYDFALIQPFWYPIAVDKKGYIPLLKMEEPFVSLIMVLDNSSIHTVDDLKGKTIASPPSFVPVVHMAKRALLQHGIVPGKNVTLNAYKSVDSCFQQVLIGAADACIAPPFAPAIFENSMNIQLRIILKSSSIPNLALVVHPRVTEVDRKIIRKTLISWSDTDKGKKLLNSIQTKQFVPIVDSEYDAVREFIKEIKAKN